MKKIILKNGILSGFAIAIFIISAMAYSYNTGNFKGQMFLGFTAMFAAFSFVFIGIKKYRDTVAFGKITFFKGFQIGISISIIASLLYVLAWGIEFYFFMPDFMDKMVAASIESLKNENINTSDLEAKIKELESGKKLYDNVFSFIAVTFAEIFPVGLVVTIMSALILKKK